MPEYNEPTSETPETTLPERLDAVPVQRDVQDMTLAELLGHFLRRPLETGEAFWAVLRPRAESEDRSRFLTVSPEDSTSLRKSLLDWLNLGQLPNRLRDTQLIRFLAQFIAFLLALAGTMTLAAEPFARRSEDAELAVGAPLFIAALGVWLFAEIEGNWQAERRWFQERTAADWVWLGLRLIPGVLIFLGLRAFWQATTAPVAQVLDLVTPAARYLLAGVVLWGALDMVRFVLRMMAKRNPGLIPGWLDPDARKPKAEESIETVEITAWSDRALLLRFVFLLGGVVSSVLVWLGTAGNTFSTPTFYLWLLSILFWVLAVAPRWDMASWLVDRIDGMRRFKLGREAISVIAVLLLIMAFAAAFRFDRLAEHPREMTDDHVEKILDAGRVRDGARNIFFANNGGREPFQMYAIAMSSYLPGLGIDYFTIKVVAAVESLLTIPAVFWMGYVLLDGQPRRRRLLVGLLAAALLAVSYWHVAITRQGLRIPLTPLFVALEVIFLSRAIRYNRRSDFIMAGLVLGFGLYMYQAVRMLPVVIVVAVAVAIYFVARNWHERLKYVVNLGTLVLISFVIFIPMFHYSVENPDLFWRRAAGRLLGDDVIQEVADDGTITIRDASLEERWLAFRENIPVLVSNVRNVLLMFHWKGDVAAISGVPNQPALDTVTGALLILGVAAWGVFFVRTRDPIIGLVPVVIFIMLLPSALSIAFPIENPSHTRTSGAIPLVYWLAALPLAVFVEQIVRAFQGWRGWTAGAVVAGLFLLPAYNANTYTYFEVYPPIYAESFDPYSEPGTYLQGFVLSGGAWGNAFMVGYPHWWSHRAIGLAAGLETQWPNGIVSRDEIPYFLEAGSLRGDRFQFYPDRDLLFFYSPDDDETGAYLQELFPEGYAQEVFTYPPNDNNFMIYRVPALGAEAFQEWLEEHLPDSG